MLDSWYFHQLISKQNEYFDNQSSEEHSKKTINVNIFSIVFNLILAVWAALLAWSCNRKVDTFVRIFVTILAFLFAWIYLVFYFIYHFIFLKPCE